MDHFDAVIGKEAFKPGIRFGIGSALPDDGLQSSSHKVAAWKLLRGSSVHASEIAEQRSTLIVIGLYEMQKLPQKMFAICRRKRRDKLPMSVFNGRLHVFQHAFSSPRERGALGSPIAAINLTKNEVAFFKSCQNVRHCRPVESDFRSESILIHARLRVQDL